MKLLFTGFDPFGGAARNPAWEAVSRMNVPEGAELYRLCVPTVFGESVKLVSKRVAELRPDYVIAVGQAAGRARITPERVAINVDDARIPDNRGNRPENLPIDADGPAAYFSTLPIYEIRDALQAEGIPCEISNTAGTFVCNHLMYGLLRETALHYPEIKAGFVHVPCIPEQLSDMPAGTPSLELSTIVSALNRIASILCTPKV